MRVLLYFYCQESALHVRERLLYAKSDAHSNWFLKERRPAATGVEATWSALRREPRELASLWPAVVPGSAVLADF